MSVPLAKIPPPGEIAARVIPFHVLFDSEYLEKDSDGRVRTRFFLHPTAFQKDASPKAFGHDTNVHTTSALPAGYRKEIHFLSLLCEGGDSATFDAEIWIATTLAWKGRVGHGTKLGVPILGGTRLGCLHPRIKHLEHFDLRIEALPELAGRLCRVNLHGPLILPVSS